MRRGSRVNSGIGIGIRIETGMGNGARGIESQIGSDSQVDCSTIMGPKEKKWESCRFNFMFRVFSPPVLGGQ